MSLVDLEAFGHALRAKVPAMLLHPQRCHWLLGCLIPRKSTAVACPSLETRQQVTSAACS